MKKINIGIIGAGTNTRKHHIPGLKKMANVEILGVCNRSRESSEKAAKELGIPRVYDNWSDMIGDDDIDAIVIGTWPYMHHTLTLAALNGGKHVLCEARMAMNEKEAVEMLQSARKHPHLVTQIVPSPFSFGVDKTIKRLISENFLGDILSVEIMDRGNWIDRESPLHWREEVDKSGLNIMSLGIWYECLIRWIGPAKSVSAVGNTFVKMRRDPQNNTLKSIRVPDHLVVSAQMECGAQAHMILSSVSGGITEKRATLYGSKGTLKMENGKLWTAVKGDNQFKEYPVPENEAAEWRVEEEFINAIRGEESVKYTSFSEGVKYMKFVEGVTKSMNEQRVVTC
jgi:predicted dehydrogenase